MSYVVNKATLQLNVTTASGLALQTVADKLFINFGYTPVIIRAMTVTVTTAITGGDQAIVALERRITAGSDTGRVTAGVPTVIVPGGTAAGKAVYKDNLNFLFSPGEEGVLRLTDAAAAGAGHVVLHYELAPYAITNSLNSLASA